MLSHAMGGGPRMIPKSKLHTDIALKNTKRRMPRDGSQSHGPRQSITLVLVTNRSLCLCAADNRKCSWKMKYMSIIQVMPSIEVDLDRHTIAMLIYG